MTQELVLLRRWSAALLMAAALIIAVVVLAPVTAQVPATIHAAEHGGTVDLRVDDTTVLTSADCVTAQWQVEGIRTVELDRRGVTGDGTRPSCTSSVTLTVTFQDGVTQTYTIDKQVRTASIAMRALLVAAVFAFGLGLIVSGLPLAVWAALRASAPGRALDARLPRMPEREGRAGITTGVLFAVVAIVLIGAVVRTHYLSRSLRYDESWTYTEFASQPPDVIVTDYRSTNNHIFHTLLVYASTRLFGIYPWTLRLPVYLTGILIIAAIFAVARRFYGIRAGLLAAALAAGASSLVEFSANGRGYNLVALDFLLLLLLAGTLRQRRRTRYWASFALLGALGLYTVPTMAYPLGLVCCWLGLSILIENRGRQRWLLLRDMLLTVILLLLLTGLLYLPAYLYIHSGISRNWDHGSFTQTSWAAFTQSYALEASNLWRDWQRDLTGGVSALLVIGVLASLVFQRRMAHFRLSLVAVALIWFPAVAFIQLVTTYARLWVFLLPLYLMLASAGLIYLWRLVAPRRLWPRVGTVAALAVLAAALAAGGVIASNSVELTTSERALGAEAAVQALHAGAPADAIILCAHKCPILQFYGLMYGVRLLPHFEPDGQPHRFYVVDSLLDAQIKVKAAIREVNLDPDDFKEPTLVMGEGDTKVYRIDPVAAQ